MEIKVRELTDLKEKSKQEIEQELLDKHEKQVNETDSNVQIKDAPEQQELKFKDSESTVTNASEQSNTAEEKTAEEEKPNVETAEEINSSSELSEEAIAQYRRANQIGSALMQMEQDLMEKRFLLNNYLSFVVDNLNKDVDEKEEK